MLVEHFGQIIERGREAIMLVDDRAQKFSQGAGYLFAALIIGVDERDGHRAGAGNNGDIGRAGHSMGCFHLPASGPGST